MADGLTVTAMTSDRDRIGDAVVIAGSLARGEPSIAGSLFLPWSHAMKQRKAVKRATEIVAECPLGGECTSQVKGRTEWMFCGHYQGCTQTRKGTWVICSYDEK
jgi:hypothetical protein